VKPILTAVCGLVLLASTAFAAGKGPEIQIIDGKVSMQADTVPLGRLLGLLDRATGMKSRVPVELANRNVSVSFSDLGFDEAVRKIFEGRSLDYLVIGGQGIVVTAVAQVLPRNAGPVGIDPSPFNQQPGFVQDAFGLDNQQPMQVMPPQPPAGNPFSISVDPFSQEGQQSPNSQQQPAVIQTPFGPIPNPNVRTNQQGNPNGAGAAVNPAAPGSNNNLFGNTSPPAFNQNNSAPPSGLPGLAPSPFPGPQQPVRK